MEGRPEQGSASASADAIPFTLLGDEPRVTNTKGKPATARTDPLGFQAQAESLAQLILGSHSSTPFTLGIEAGWGMGKSSLMRSLDAQLSADGSVETVWFNAWTANNGEVLEGLIKSVLNTLDGHSLRKAARNEQLIGWLRIAMLSGARLVGFGNLADEIWKRISLDPKARNDARELMQRAMEQWRGKNTGVGNRLLVVFVDDLDRCSPENVFQAFEAMKLYLDAPGFVFVVGYDADVISDAILRHKMYGKEITSRGYIEKIVQIVHRIPPPGDEAAAAFLQDCLDESGTTRLFDDTARELVTERNARNPRRIKRFLNSFVLGYGLDPTWAEFGAEKLMKVLILQLYFPDFARLLYDRSQDPIGEFFEYRRVREIFQRSGPVDEIDEFLERHGLVGIALGTEGLADLDKSVLEELPPLLRRPEFSALIESFRDPSEREQLLDRIRRRPPPQPTEDIVPGTTGVPDPEATKFQTPLHVVWIDDKPEGNATLARDIEERGGRVTLIKPGDEFEALRALQPHVLISDIRRDDNETAGLDALERIRKEKIYTGPAIFYTGRITGARRDQAQKLDASITNVPRGVIRFLSQVDAKPSRDDPSSGVR